MDETTTIATSPIVSLTNNSDKSEELNPSKDDNGDNTNTLLKDMTKLHDRLQACNVTQYYFVNDNNHTNQYSPIQSKCSKAKLERTLLMETKYSNAIHVKTLIWSGVYLKSNNNNNNKKNGNNYYNENDNENWNKPFYFVTALRMQDKVDVQSLRALVKRQWPNQNEDGGGSSGVLILQLAQQNIAEELTGFESGSMPPGWHSYPMSLFIDDNIIEEANLSIPTSSSSLVSHNDIYNDANNVTVCNETLQTKHLSNESLSHIIISVGSGVEDYSLHISLADVFNSSIYYNSNIENGNQEYSNSRKLYKNNGIALRQICSFSRARIERINKYQQAKRVLNGVDESKHNESMSLLQPRSDKDILKTLTRKALNSASKTKGKTQDVKRMIDVMGSEKFAMFMKVDRPNGDNRFAGEFNKNALHYASWKGDLETMTLLINKAKEYDDLGDVVNMISTGEGNYGKTPIFYSITQCRDDAVLLLLSHGANLLIVNNKGQTPCSLAVNKLKKETLTFMFQMETNQLKAGGVFLNYRESHSDGKRYGDLDPRFIQVGDVNIDDDILEEMGLSSILSDLSNVDLKDTFLPRSVRVTSELTRGRKWSKAVQTLPMQQSKNNQSVNTDTKDYGETLQDFENNQEPLSTSKMRKENVSYEQPIQYKSANPIAKLADGTELDISSLPVLLLHDILYSSTDNNQRTYELIDDEAGLLIFQFAVDESISRIDPDQKEEDDNIIIDASWGLDCEWKPSHVSGEENPVSVLQLSSASRAFVIDLQSLLRGDIKEEDVELTHIETIVSETLAKLFVDPKIRILGFGIGQDLTKLAASFPHIPCFREFNSVMDLQALSRQFYPGTSKQFMSSLQKAVAILLKKRLDKTEQCSEWDCRPLSASQLEYASLDATVLPKLLRCMTQNNKSFTVEKGYFFKRHSYLQTSYRFKYLSDDVNIAYRVVMGSIKRSLDMKFARQVWPTHKQPPSAPEVIPLHEQSFQAKLKPMRKKEKSENQSQEVKKSRRNPISVSVLTGDLTNLPLPGTTLGYTKESVIERVVRKQVIESLPEGAYLQYNRRGGIIELGNIFLLFVNFGVGRVHHKYRNEFLNNGKHVTFTINQSRYEDGELLQTLLTPPDEAMYYRKSVLFFIRASTKDKFMFCGKAKYLQHEEKQGDLIDLVLELTSFDDLVHHSNLNSNGDNMTYMKIVESQIY